jgi:hypothetical protein
MIAKSMVVTLTTKKTADNLEKNDAVQVNIGNTFAVAIW